MSLSCCIWIYIRRVAFSLGSNQEIHLLCFQESTLSRGFSSSHYFSSLAARYPTMQAISLSITLHEDCESPQQHNTILSRIARSKKLYCSIHNTSLHIILLGSQHMKAASSRPHRHSSGPFSLNNVSLSPTNHRLDSETTCWCDGPAAAYTTPLSLTFQRYRLAYFFTDS
jgi:hypothetical protein